MNGVGGWGKEVGRGGRGYKQVPDLEVSAARYATDHRPTVVAREGWMVGVDLSSPPDLLLLWFSGKKGGGGCKGD